MLGCLQVECSQGRARKVSDNVRSGKILRTMKGAPTLAPAYSASQPSKANRFGSAENVSLI